jgi:hypothetical protein
VCAYPKICQIYSKWVLGDLLNKKNICQKIFARKY